MGQIAITGHFERPKVRKLAAAAKKTLQSLGAECAAADIGKKRFNARNVSIVIAVGGDGTLLRTVRELKGQKPVVGIAAGEHCALMQIKPAQMRKAMRKIAAGKYKVQKMMRLLAFADGKKLPLALNEAMLLNKKSGAIINFCLRVNEMKKYCARADGCIVATATGSSGHAFSAGGKKLGAGSSVIAIVPSNPLNRAVKAMCVSGSSRIALSGFSGKQEYEVVLDGQPRFPVRKSLLVKRGKEAVFLRV